MKTITLIVRLLPVSYTHLDVYKRQPVGQLDEGQRGGPVRYHRMIQIDVRGLQRFAQHIAHQIGGKPGQKARIRPEPRQRDRGVHHRPAGIGGKTGLARRAGARQHINQGFATA